MKILIIEDEPQIAGELNDLLVKINPEAEIVGMLDSIDSSVKFLSEKRNTPELIFMDIQLADGLSFEIFTRVEINCPVIFCTAYDQYKLQAFKCNGIDYILKPIKECSIRSAFEKIEKLKLSFNSNNDILEIIKNALPQQKSYSSSLLTQNKGKHIPIPVDNIAFFYLSDEIVYAYCFNSKKFPVYKTLEEIESTLNPDNFYRINRQILLNRNSIKEIQPYINRTVIVKTELPHSEQLIVSQFKVSTFLKWIEHPLKYD
jgi:DNA-binding LytR/AlgR family response regulator